MNRRRAVVCSVLALVAAGLALRLRLAAGPAFVGADSVGYVALAHELKTDHRFAVGPAPAPLQWYRRPLYPLFLAAFAVDRADPAGTAHGVQVAQSLIDVLAGFLAFLCARKLAGPIAGWVTLSVAMLCPLTLPYTSALLTETLAGALALAAVAPLLLSRRPRWLLAGAAATGLSALVRPEGALVGLAFIPVLYALPRGRRARLAAACLGVFLLVFGAWPARNLIRFGQPHLADGMVDRLTRDVPHWRGYWDWLTSWGHDEHAFTVPPTCFYDHPRCMPTVESYDRLGAFDDPAERREVARLLELRQSEGVSPAVSDGFETLARARRANHPFATLVTLPLSRTVRLWIGPQSELPTPHPLAVQVPLLLLALAGAIALARDPTTRVGALAILLVLAVRSEVLGWTGFCLPRYLQPMYGLVFIIAGAGAAALIRVLPWRSFRPTIEAWTRGASSNP